MTLFTCTCDPPSCAAMLPQKFSAASTRIVREVAPPGAAPDDDPEVVASLVAPQAAITATVPNAPTRPTASRTVTPCGRRARFLPCPARSHTSDNEILSHVNCQVRGHR